MKILSCFFKIDPLKSPLGSLVSTVGNRVAAEYTGASTLPTPINPFSALIQDLVSSVNARVAAEYTNSTCQVALVPLEGQAPHPIRFGP